jgi:hypothetical protein
MKDEFVKEPLSAGDKTRFPQYNAESIVQKGVCGVERLLRETVRSDSVTEIQEKIAIQNQRRMRDGILYNKEIKFTRIHGEEEGRYTEESKKEVGDMRTESMEINWLGEEFEAKREDRLLTQLKNTQDNEDKADKACSAYLAWMSDTVDSALQAVVQKHIKANPGNKIKQIQESEKEIEVLMKGDITVVRIHIKQQLENVGMMNSMQEVVPAMEMITKLRRQMKQSHDMYGGDQVMREYDYKIYLEKRLAMDDQGTLRIRNVLEVMGDEATWEDIVERVTGMLEKEKIHTGVQGQSSSSLVNHAKKEGGKEIEKLTKQVHNLTKAVSHEKKMRKQGGSGQSDNMHEELMKQGICFFWMKGRCSKGKDCKFKHQKPVDGKRKASPSRSPSVSSVGSTASKSSGGSASSADSRLTKKGEKKKRK